MKVVVQRVSEAEVKVDSKTVGKIGSGLLLLLGISKNDTEQIVEKAAQKISKQRIFQDNEGKMNLSVADIGGSILAVSQFTLLADTKKGNRPSFIDAAGPELAEPLYEKFCSHTESLGIQVEKGIFGADMKVSLINDGPVTIVIDI
ncbi:MAG: D-aminoacyl-tRNA deacylase [Planctomycetota bacterium]|jgi:D-tyrosyl-tRNA(Tyr) deacylase